MRARLAAWLLAALLLGGCATPASRPGPGEPPLFLVSHGWHTGIALRAADIDFERWRPLPHPARARYIVVGFDEPPARYFPRSEVRELRVPQAGFERLLAYIAASFEPGAAPIAPGLYATGAFYPSRETFHLFNTCNTWVARGLREAGLSSAP